MTREPLSNADFAVMRLGSPENLMIITSLMILETRIGADELKAVLERSLARNKRFRQRVVMPVSPLLKAFWVEDKTFDVSNHIECIHTPLPGDPKFLEDLVSRLMSVDLDPSRPLWKFYLVEQYGDGSALVFRLHHSITDGVALVKILLSMTQDKPGLPAAPAYPEPADGPETGRNGSTSGARQVFNRLSRIGKRLLNDAEAMENFTRAGVSAVTAVGQLVFSAPDTGNQFNGTIGITKRATWTPALSLDQIKFVSKCFGCTINDVLLSAVAGALRHYSLNSHYSTETLDMHTIVPVDMRRTSRLAPVQSLIEDLGEEKMGNQVGAALLNLPLSVEDPVERLEAVHHTMETLKASGEGLLTYWMMSAMGAIPGGLQDLATTFWLTKSSAVMTNVMGPKKQLYFGSAALDTVLGWVPQFGPVGLGVCIFSYNGRVWLGIAADQGLVPSPEKIVDYFLDDLRLLGRRAIQASQVDMVPSEQASS